MARIWARGGCRRWAVAAVMAALLAPGCGGGSEGSSGPPLSDPRGEVQAMLKERALALAGGDLEGFLRPLAPAARSAEEPLARGSTAVALDGLELFLGETTFDRSATGAMGAEVDVIYNYADIPADNPFRFRLVYDLERRGGAWRVTASQPDPELPPPVWATGPVETAGSAHFLALFRPGLADVEAVLRLLEESRAALVPKLTLEPDPRHVVVLVRDEAQFAELYGPGVAAAAVALAEANYRGTAGHPPRPENRQMVVNLERALRQPDAKVPFRHEGQQDRETITAAQVFQHELAHLALTRFTRPTTPGWVVEGAAMYLSGERRPELEAGFRQRVFERLSFSSLSRQTNLRSGLEYAFAAAAVRHLVDRAGAATFWEFYRNFKDLRPSGDLAEDLARGTRRLLRRFYGIDERELDRRTRERIEQDVVGAGASGP